MEPRIRLCVALPAVAIAGLLACSSATVPCQPRGDEQCNGIDDDCDGATDEGFAVGEACDGPDSDECANGTTTCTSDGSGTECVNEDPEGIVETCNNADDDCDGDTDEELVGCGCTGGGTPREETCNRVDDDCDGEIDDGIADCQCSGGNPPGTEVCDGVDNDCDEEIDEGFAVGEPCDGPDSDECANGTTTCTSDGSGTECVNEDPADIVETCNNIDDNCDGSTDESLVGCGCTAGGTPSDETCNDIDDDCNGEIDDGLVGCGCTGGGTPSGETCNNIDDDCDGEIDEELIGCGCTGGGTPSGETCNNIDDDCDGEIDEELIACGCTGGGTPSAETCNNTDDDCNGQVDDGVPDCQCSGGNPPGTEVCDGIDNDCDEEIDEDNGMGGGCAAFGEPCSSYMDCVSLICAGDSFERYCSAECDPLSDPATWPDGYRCIIGPNRDYYARNYDLCGSDDDCAPDGVCTVQEADDQLSLLTECRPPMDSGALPGEDCSGDRCANDMCSWYTDLCSEVCSLPADCDGQYLGYDTACVFAWKTVTPGDCGRDEQCPAGYTCEGAQCMGPECTIDDECEDGYGCLDVVGSDPLVKACLPYPFFNYIGECRIACAGDPDCPAGMQCNPAVAVDYSAIQGYCRNPPSGDIINTGDGPCGIGYDNCSHGICYGSGAGSYCTQLCGESEDCPGVMACTPGILNMGELGSYPDTMTCTQ